MIGRAASSPLPAPVLERLGPSLTALHQAMHELLLNLAQALEHRRKPPNAAGFQAALNAFLSEAEALRADAPARELPGKTLGQVFALGFAFEQFQKNLNDLLKRTEELTVRRTNETAGS